MTARTRLTGRPAEVKYEGRMAAELLPSDARAAPIDVSWQDGEGAARKPSAFLTLGHLIRGAAGRPTLMCFIDMQMHTDARQSKTSTERPPRTPACTQT